MARLSATQRLIVEDFPDQKDWIGNLLDPINEFITKTLLTINGGIEFSSNIIGLEKEFDFVYVSESVTFPQQFRWTLSKKPASLIVAAASENVPTSNRNFSPIMLLASWQLNSQNEVELTGAVKITTSGVAALTAGNRYKIKVRVTP